jgi:Rod binding domain-containing protein
MSSPIRPTEPPQNSPHARLMQSAQALEAVFLQQMFQAMREATPQGGLIEQSAGEQVFRGMLDEQLALEAVKQNERGLAISLYRQLSRHLPPVEATAVALPANKEAASGVEG